MGGNAAWNAAFASSAVAGGTLDDCVSSLAASEGAETESSRISRRSSSFAALPEDTGAELAAAVAGHAGAGFTSAGAVGRGAGTVGGATADIGFVDAVGFSAGIGLAAAGLLATGFAAGAAGAAAGMAAVAAGFEGSPLRKSPRATRRVPLACSMLMGLVR